MQIGPGDFHSGLSAFGSQKFGIPKYDAGEQDPEGGQNLKRNLIVGILLVVLLPLTLISCRNEITIESPSTEQATQQQIPTLSSDQFLPTSSPDEQGIDGVALSALVERAANGEFGLMDSLIVIRNGHIVTENYFREYTGETPHRLYSVSKSITSLLIGIAIEKGFIEGIDQKLLDFYPEYDEADIANWDDRKAGITLQNLLTMRAGFSWNEGAGPYGSATNPTTPLFQSLDWMKHMIDLELSHDPGARFNYNSGVTMLLSGIIRNTTGMTAREFAEEYLYGPLGISVIDWEIGAPESISNTGWGAFLRSIDMAKIGYMVLNGGVWNGEQIVSKSWLDQSTTPHVNRGTGGYGYQWWLEAQRDLPDHTPSQNDVWSANGWGGQFIFVVPLSNMVVVMNAENYTNGRSGSQRNVLFRNILRATEPLESSTQESSTDGAISAMQPNSCDFQDVNFVFQGDPNATPAVRHGPDSRWDGKYINPGAMIFHDGKFHMFRNGFHDWPGVISVGYMTSEDGIEWDEVQEKELFNSTSASYAAPGLDVSSVVVESDGTWVLYFHTVNSSQPWQIGRATSNSPLGPWIFDEELVFTIGEPGSWDDAHVKWPSVVRTDSGYVMFYAGQSSEFVTQIGRATSADGVVWVRDSEPVLSPTTDGWDEFNVDRPVVQLTPDGWAMIYQGSSSLNNRGLAISADGIEWVRHPNNPIMTAPQFPRPSNTTWDTSLVFANNQYFYFMEIGTLTFTDIYASVHEGLICRPDASSSLE